MSPICCSSWQHFWSILFVFRYKYRLQFYSTFKINTYKTYIFRLVLPQEMAQVITWTVSFTGSSRICPQNLDLPFFWSTCSSCTYHCMALSVNSSSVTSHWWMWICMFSILFRLVIYSVIIICTVRLFIKCSARFKSPQASTNDSASVNVNLVPL